MITEDAKEIYIAHRRKEHGRFVRYPFGPDENEPVDRWYQTSDGWSCRFAETLIDESVLDGSPLVVDPFMGSGATGLAAQYLGFDFLGAESVASRFAVAAAKLEAREADPDQFARLSAALLALKRGGALPSLLGEYCEFITNRSVRSRAVGAAMLAGVVAAAEAWRQRGTQRRTFTDALESHLALIGGDLAHLERDRDLISTSVAVWADSGSSDLLAQRIQCSSSDSVAIVTSPPHPGSQRRSALPASFEIEIGAALTRLDVRRSSLRAPSVADWIEATLPGASVLPPAVKAHLERVGRVLGEVARARKSIAATLEFEEMAQPRIPVAGLTLLVGVALGYEVRAVREFYTEAPDRSGGGVGGVIQLSRESQP